ncbi:hypothetical protein [Nonomuraea sp. NPDC050310]|uniref:hypothetical protein n=1 Tax=Nonomuraea sp. NPDC050310 TaxID=3154935 RepID=UPI0033CA1521
MTAVHHERDDLVVERLHTEQPDAELVDAELVDREPGGGSQAGPVLTDMTALQWFIPGRSVGVSAPAAEPYRPGRPGGLP